MPVVLQLTLTYKRDGLSVEQEAVDCEWPGDGR